MRLFRLRLSVADGPGVRAVGKPGPWHVDQDDGRAGLGLSPCGLFIPCCDGIAERGDGEPTCRNCLAALARDAKRWGTTRASAAEEA